ncbi:GNAT family N-acetyltransferase [Chroogloeocystis siderophila]|jgi:N-acetylglutamate synthase-like GNAT family acetyltransferase|uniref:GNAT family N-acetyltransferase n=1 Tax=Chroogloeocystis siderophila 5.2 s.c.1 TaxID=247279 RepID=A0A1U7HVZ1_9CHRO|nr:GNAT family N-acetyltransferase [Chroogloeocystis siderophila]OKH27760.1 GNAT family N-acetyltransferase [Chroogloeocystis siderophila 5.2 s.c.1]
MDYSHIQFCDSSIAADGHCQSPVDIHQLHDLFHVAAFWAQDRSLEDLQLAIANSKPVISVWDGEKLIGFARATSDGVYRATIWDVVIHPDYRGAGLGRKLVESVLSHPHMNRVERVYLMTTHQQSFYERIGFECNSSTTMVLHNQPKLGFPTQEIQLQELPRG